MFQSETKNLLFNDNTECLARLHGKTTYEKYLGSAYVSAIANLKKCSTSRKWNIEGVDEKPPCVKVKVGGTYSILGMKMAIKVLRQYNISILQEISVFWMR